MKIGGGSAAKIRQQFPLISISARIKSPNGKRIDRSSSTSHGNPNDKVARRGNNNNERYRIPLTKLARRRRRCCVRVQYHRANVSLCSVLTTEKFTFEIDISIEKDGNERQPFHRGCTLSNGTQTTNNTK
jgi:hypothetical protein